MKRSCGGYYDMWRSDAMICIVKTKKGAAKK